MRWTREEDEVIRDMVARGATYAMIAKAISTTRSAVAGRAKRIAASSYRPKKAPLAPRPGLHIRDRTVESREHVSQQPSAIYEFDGVRMAHLNVIPASRMRVSSFRLVLA